ncbi:MULTISPECIES: alpha/beta hydrolase [unclassified Glutamicibacter]|uniref:alpha/beta hydrolase n=1 Tax=unclassified Glutamicibacter TaxID=2627139 RepID=UPI00381EB12C
METSTLSSRLSRWAALSRAWLQDYLYAGAWQLRSLLPGTEAGRLLSGSHPAAEPVVLIPGIWESWKFLLPLADALHQAGHPVHVIPQLGFNRGTVPEMSQVVSSYLGRAQLDDAVLVAHSKGGLIGKYLMSASSQGYRINRMIAIGTPFSGSRYARYAPVRSLRSLSPNDQGLLKLSANLSVNSRIISIYSSFDPHIPGGCDLAGATNIKLPTLGHFRLLADVRLHAAVLKHLAPGLPPAS